MSLVCSLVRDSLQLLAEIRRSVIASQVSLVHLENVFMCESYTAVFVSCFVLFFLAWDCGYSFMVTSHVHPNRSSFSQICQVSSVQRPGKIIGMNILCYELL